MSPIPLVSVCIPVYNGEQHIQETIESVQKQTFSDFELLIQDNASTDATWELLARLAAQDPRISLARNPSNLGMSGNWNAVIDRARGKFVMLLSADDLLMPEFLHVGLEALGAPDLAAVSTNHLFLKNNVITKRPQLVHPGIYRYHGNIILKYNPFSINFTIFRRSFLDTQKNNGRLFKSYYTCDYDLCIRIALSGAKIQYISDCLGIYRVHEMNLSRQVKKMSRQTTLTLLVNKEELGLQCRQEYRVTLVRFILRSLLRVLRYRYFDKRLLMLMVASLLQSVGR